MYPLEELQEGDFFAINDPYSGGQHLQDVFLFHPIFFASRLIGFSASVAHHLDLGGGSPGLNPAATDVWAEGLIIPPLKLNMARDWHGGMFERLLRANVRVPHQTMGDFDAQMAANAIGMARVKELAERYGADKVVAAMAALQDYSETRMRAAIRAVPDGVYRGEDAIDDDGDSDAPLPVRATVTVTRRQRRGGFHRHRAAGAAASEFAVRIHRVGGAVMREGGADQSGHSVQRRCGAAGDDNRAGRLAVEPAPSGAGARAHGGVFPRLECHDEGAGAGGAGSGDRLRLRHHDRRRVLASGAAWLVGLSGDIRRWIRRLGYGGRQRCAGWAAVELLEHADRGAGSGLRILPRAGIQPAAG